MSAERHGTRWSAGLAEGAACWLALCGLALFVDGNCPGLAAEVANSPPAAPPRMYFADTDRGQRFAKDPDVVRFKGRLLMYYSLQRPGEGFAIGIASSEDLDHWTKEGELLSGAESEQRGLCAPAAIVMEGKVHLFYQTYGNGPQDAICHATSSDGLKFTRNPANPIFRPHGNWNCGRAIDADVIPWGDRLMLYVATRDPAYRTQMVAGAWAPLKSDYAADKWTQVGAGPLLHPELAWEKRCIEAPSVVRQGDRFFMFYAGGYNNEPQQIGCAVSQDGVRWQRLSDQPLLPNGAPGEWNSSESGHPGVFVDDDGQAHLFFQGNNDRGKTWFLSRMRIQWETKGPYLVRPGDDTRFHLK